MNRQRIQKDTDLSARERILLTSHDLFYREGIRATGIDRIIKEAGVTKVTLYRHFPSKNDLIAAYLDYRHERWMNWFRATIKQATKQDDFPLAPVITAMREWFTGQVYRGCAFINGVVEFDGELPAVMATSQRHKREMATEIAGLLPAVEKCEEVAQAAALAVDGAIIHAQIYNSAETALVLLEKLLRSLCDQAFPESRS